MKRVEASELNDTKVFQKGVIEFIHINQKCHSQYIILFWFFLFSHETEVNYMA